MSSPLSVGDVAVLCSLALKIGRAFTSGRAGAPAEFREVENELQSLKTSLNTLVDTLNEDDSILSRADRRTVDGLTTILSSCSEVGTQRRTLLCSRKLTCAPDTEESRFTRHPISKAAQSRRKP